MMRKRYKEYFTKENMIKRGQVALFVLVAVAIIAIFIWLVVYPRIEVYVSEVDPSQYLRECIEPELKTNLDVLMSQGGYSNPTHYLTNNDVKLQYLCYTSEYYVPCVVQQPLLVRHVEQELKSKLQPLANNCMQTLQELYRGQGYDVQATSGEINVSIIQDFVQVEYNAPFRATKGQTQTFRKFSVKVPSQSYNLLITATSIVQYESTFGDSETSLYMQFYPDLNIEKLKKNADTIYTLTDVVSKEKFSFATRSLTWPQGYGVTQ